MPRPARAADALTDAQKRIIEAAVETFAEQGFHGTSTREIARRAGVAEATVFKYFPRKQELLLGVLRPALEHLLLPAMARSLGPVLEAKHATFEAFLRALFMERLAFARAHPKLIRVLAQELPFHEDLRERALDALGATLLPNLFTQLEAFQRAGEVVDWPLPTVLRSIFSLGLGHILHRVFLAPTDGAVEREELEQIIALLVRGLAPPSPPRPSHRTRKAAGGK